MSHEPTAYTEDEYIEAEQAYFATLTIEHFAQAIGQSRQRERTVGSFAVLRTHRPDVRYFNELLVQYPWDGKIQQVVPDNMVVCSAEPIKLYGSFNIPFQPARPFLVLDYISSLSKR